MEVKVDIKRVTEKQNHYFFGYYDKLPWDLTGELILAMKVPFMDRVPTENDPATIGLIHLKKGNVFKPIAKTNAWNWQQGAMLQWLASKSVKSIIYNDLMDGKLVSVILDTETNEKRILPCPVYTVSHNGNFALSVNFARLHEVREGYGYSGVIDPYRDQLHPKNDGINRLNLSSGEYKQIISIDRVAKFQNIPNPQFGKHWFNHLLLNPGDSRFCFLHRFESEDGGIYTRLITADFNGNNLRCLLDTGMASHFDWYDSKKIVIWARKNQIPAYIQKSKFGRSFFFRKIIRFLRGRKLKMIRRKIIQDHFFLVSDVSEQIQVMSDKLLVAAGGHCSFSPDRKWMLTDTSINKNSERKLIVYNIEKDICITLGKFYTPPEIFNTPFRCDLHPRWNRDGTQICFDSVHEGYRGMYIVDVKEVIETYS